MKGNTFAILTRLFDQDESLEKERPFMEPEKYEAVVNAEKAVFGWALFIVFFVIAPLIVLFSVIAIKCPITNAVKQNIEPAGTVSMQVARVDYEGDFWWRQNSEEHEYSLADYGLDPQNYEYGDQVFVYLDADANVLAVNDTDKVGVTRAWEQGISMAGAIILPIIICVVFYLKARSGFGREWCNFIS